MQFDSWKINENAIGHRIGIANNKKESITINSHLHDLSIITDFRIALSQDLHQVYSKTGLESKLTTS